LILGTFGCFQLSPDEKQLVYIAEKKEVKKQSYLQFGISTTAEGTKVVMLNILHHSIGFFKKLFDLF